MSDQFAEVGNGLLVRAPAKVNLSLLVAGKREDGYHNIESIMAKINWYDEILIEPPVSAGIELICKGECPVPGGRENLVYRAARILFDAAGRQSDIRITLTKNIPPGSGLGSGSSDAAATLMGINRFLDLGVDRRALAGFAAEIGSDVAFFLGGPLALCTGRGEEVKKLPEYEFSAFLVVPTISVSTKRVYENYVHDEAVYRQLHREISELIMKKRIDLICRLCANMLQKTCFELHTELRETKEKMERAGVGPVCLSGSGSSMFCIIDNGQLNGADKYRDILEREPGCRCMFVRNNSW